MFNKLLAVFLIISLQSVSFAMLLVDAGFQLNQKLISEKLCENRAKPKLNCQGKCYLTKMKKKAAEQKETGEDQIKQLQFQQLFINHPSSLAFYSSNPTSFQFPENNNEHLKGWPRETYRPPGLI